MQAEQENLVGNGFFSLGIFYTKQYFSIIYHKSWNIVGSIFFVRQFGVIRHKSCTIKSTLNAPFAAPSLNAGPKSCRAPQARVFALPDSMDRMNAHLIYDICLYAP